MSAKESCVNSPVVGTWQGVLALFFVLIGLAIFWQGPAIIQEAMAVDSYGNCYGQPMPTEPGNWRCCDWTMGWIDFNVDCCGPCDESCPPPEEPPDFDYWENL